MEDVLYRQIPIIPKLDWTEQEIPVTIISKVEIAEFTLNTDEMNAILETFIRQKYNLPISEDLQFEIFYRDHDTSEIAWVKITKVLK